MQWGGGNQAEDGHFEKREESDNNTDSRKINYKDWRRMELVQPSCTVLSYATGLSNV